MQLSRGLFETFKSGSGLKIAKGGTLMGTSIRWETSLTTAKAKAKKEKKFILMDYYNNL
jgi:hypothetical protein